MNGFRSVPHQQRHVMRFHYGARINHKTHVSAHAFTDQVLMQRAHRKQHRNCHTVAAHGTVRDDEDVKAHLDGVDSLRADAGKACLDTGLTPGSRIGDVKRLAAELTVGVVGDIVELGHIAFRENGLRNLDTARRIDVVDVKQIGLGSDKADETRDKLLPDRVNRRIGDLSKKLLEVVKKGLALFGKNRKRRIVTHTADRFLPLFSHGHQDEIDVFLRDGKSLLQLKKPFSRQHCFFRRARLVFQIPEAQIKALNPFAVGLGKH